MPDSWVATLGHILIIVSAIPSVIAAPNHAAMAPFILGLIFFGIGVGFFKTNISPLIAEQVSVSPFSAKAS